MCTHTHTHTRTHTHTHTHTPTHTHTHTPEGKQGFWIVFFILFANMTVVAITCSHTHTEFSWPLLDGLVSTAMYKYSLYYQCNVWLCVCSVSFFSFQIITQYVYELLEKKCNMTKAILPVSTQNEKRNFLLWFVPLKIKGIIKYENWRKCWGFRVWLWYWVSCLKK